MRKNTKKEQPSFEGIHDPNNYRAMSVPYESMDVALEQIRAFIEDIRPLRAKYKIPDLHYIIRFSIMTDEGEGTTMVNGHMGSTLEAEGMLACALGQEAKDRQERTARLMAGKTK